MGCCASFLHEVAPLRSSASALKSADGAATAAQDCEVTSNVTQPSQDLTSASQLGQSGGLVYRSASSAAKGLIAFAKTGDLVRGRELLMQGADPSAPGMWGSTPLLVACEYGRQEFAELLLSHECEVDTPNRKNATPLLYACIHGFVEIVEKLIARGATVDPDVAVVYNPKYDVVGPLTPLAAAAANGYEHIVEKLISAGAQVDRTMMPAQQQQQQGKKELPYAGATALSIACAMGQTAVAQSLLAASADVSIGDSKGDTALHYACMQTSAPEMVDMIIQNVRDNQKVDVASVLNATNQKNETPLHVACSVGALHALEVLLEAGADPNVVSTSHWTPLHVAVQKGCATGVGLLVAHGADPSIQDLEKQTPYDSALKLGRREILDLLEQQHPPGPTTEEKPGATPPTTATVTVAEAVTPQTSGSQEGAEVAGRLAKKPISATAVPLEPTSPSAKKSEVLSPRTTRVASAARALTPATPTRSDKTATSGTRRANSHSQPAGTRRGQLSPKKPSAPRTTPASTLARIRHRPAPIKTNDLEEHAATQPNVSR